MAVSWDPAVLDGVVSATRRQRVVVLAETADELAPLAEPLRGLAAFGHQVVLVWLRGTPGPALAPLTTRRPLAPGPIRRPAGLVRQLATTPPAHWWGDRTSLVGAIRLDPRTRRVLGRAEVVVPVGEAARRVAVALLPAGATVADPAGLHGWSVLDSVTALGALEQEIADDPGQVETDRVVTLVDQLGLLAGGVPPERQGLLLTVVEVLHDRGELELAATVLTFVDEHTGDPVEQALRRGWKVLVTTSAAGARQPGDAAAVTALVRAADRALEDDDEPRAVDAAHLALSLLFHRELHADGTSSPLVEDPDTFLASWRASRVGRLLAASTPREGTGRCAPRRAGVLVEPGAWPRFAAPVLEALRRRTEVVESDLARRSGYGGGLSVRRHLVEQRLAQALGRLPVPRYDLLEQTEQVEAVFVDWADPAALATVMNAAAGVPLTLRIHSMDALSCWIHLIDWSRVTHLVLVSEPLRLLVTRLLGEALEHTQVHVVPNVVDLARVVTEKEEGHRRRLLMVGWAQQVKDPLFALDVLAALLAEDPSWRLRLVGADFLPGAVRSQQGYARAFRRRMAEPDVRHAVELVGYTDTVAPHVAASGFVLSTSRRESFGVGLVEAAAAGTVPVVRDWPIFAPLGGARSLFPDDWVVDTVDEAVARIRELAEDPAWSQASRDARQVVARRFDGERAADALVALVLP